MNGKAGVRKKTSMIIVIILTLGITIFTTGCGKEIESQWRVREVRIDGENTEWSGAVNSFEDGDVLVGALNDGEFLYMSLYLADPETQIQLLTQGCTVWFDPEGGNERVFGIHYPLGRDKTREERPDRDASSGKGASRSPVSPFDSEALQKMADALPPDLEILGPEEVPLRRQPSGMGGIETAIQVYEASMIYEIKVPLSTQEDCPFAIGATQGAEIAVGLETPEIERPERSDRGGGGSGGAPSGRGGGGGRPGGGGGRGGGRPGGGGGGMGGRGGGGNGPELSEPLDVWVKVKLGMQVAAD